MTPEERIERIATGPYDTYRDDWYDPGLRAKLADAIREAVAAERERCLGVAITVIRPESDPTRGGYDAGWNDACEDVAHRIREGGAE